MGVDDYKSSDLIARPAVVGSTITEVLNLEPGTKYYVTIYAVNHNTVQISPDQRAQDSSSATTLLSAPFLGALEWELTSYSDHDEDANTDQTPDGGTCDAPVALTETEPCILNWRGVDLNDDDYKGAHFALYTARDEAGQHYFRWLNPAHYGPFDHVLAKKDNKQADMLSLDKDGDVEDHCENKDINGDCGHTHYQFKAVDDNGNTVASELVETNGKFVADDRDFFQAVFTAESGDLTLSVSLGRKVGGKYKAMSDTASVMFEAPDDLRALDQTYAEYHRVNTDITDGVDKEEDIERYRDSVFVALSPDSDAIKEWTEDADVKSATPNKLKMQAYLNNQLK